MAQEVSFNTFFAKVKTEFAKNGLAIPEDIEMIELAHMEYVEEEASVDEFIQRMVVEYKGSTE
jgi:hypothetical protein